MYAEELAEQRYGSVLFGGHHRQPLLAMVGPTVDLATALRPRLKGSSLPVSLRLHIGVPSAYATQAGAPPKASTAPGS